MFQPNEGLGDTLHGGQVRGGGDLLWAVSTFWLCTCSTQKLPLENSFEALLALSSSFCLLPSRSTSRSFCTVTQLQKEAEGSVPKWVCRQLGGKTERLMSHLPSGRQRSWISSPMTLGESFYPWTTELKVYSNSPPLLLKIIWLPLVHFALGLS